MSQKICVITGCNSGIGKATAIELARQDFEIIMLVRDSEKSRMAFEDIKKLSGGKVVLKYVDLASIESIKKVSKEIKTQYSKIDVLINNAGLVKRKFEKSADGLEMTLAVNYFALFVLTHELLPLIRKSNKARIINVTSELYKNGEVDLENDLNIKHFNGNKAYANSKLLVIYFTKELAKRLSSTKITVSCVHPGVVATDAFREYPRIFVKLLNLFIAKPEKGAKPLVHLAASADLEEVTGKYFYKSNIRETAKLANDEILSREIWKKTEEITRVSLS